MGVLGGKGDGRGFVTQAALQSTIRNVKAQYPTFGGVAAWEYWDAGINDGFQDPAQWVKDIGDAVSS